MLIKCPECSNNISDKAAACPQCGYPINLPSQNNKPLNEARRPLKWHRLENGFGHIKHLTGKRRKPYAAYPPAKDYVRSKSALGYFATYQEALKCLAEYHHSPYDSKGMTLKDVYDAWYQDKYEKGSFSDASKRSTRAAFNNLAPLHSLLIKDIKTDTMQEVIDKCPLKHASIEIMVSVLKQVYRYAMQRDIISRNYAEYIRIKIEDDDEKGVPFTEDEIRLLWNHQDDKGIHLILIMIYTGLRISELTTMTIYADKHYMQGGLKTKAGKNRIVPIHPSIEPFINDIKKLTNVNSWRNDVFHPALYKLGIAVSSKATKHTPHDCRHTFSWLCDKYKVDHLSKMMIMGHSPGKDVESTVYGHRTTEELYKEIKKIVT